MIRRSLLSSFLSKVVCFHSFCLGRSSDGTSISSSHSFILMANSLSSSPASQSKLFKMIAAFSSSYWRMWYRVPSPVKLAPEFFSYITTSVSGKLKCQLRFMQSAYLRVEVKSIPLQPYKPKQMMSAIRHSFNRFIWEVPFYKE